ncbi:MAG: hypothetical protein AB8U69_03285 [Anaplasma ovis]
MYIPEDCFSSSLAGVITSLALGHVACGRLFSFDGRGVVPVFGSCGMGACGNFSLGAAGPAGTVACGAAISALMAVVSLPVVLHLMI